MQEWEPSAGCVRVPVSEADRCAYEELMALVDTLTVKELAAATMDFQLPVEVGYILEVLPELADEPYAALAAVMEQLGKDLDERLEQDLRRAYQAVQARG